MIHVSARNSVLIVVGVALALWMGAGRWAFGIGGDLTLWFVPAITLPYAWVMLWVVRRLRLADQRGFRIGRAVYVSLALSWGCAICFGFTAPDRVDGELLTILGQLGGPEWHAMSIALCNPFGIVAFATAFVALGFAIAVSREPRAEEDELASDLEFDAATGMVRHPLHRGN